MKLSEFFERMLTERCCLLSDDAVSYDDELPFCEDCMVFWHELMAIKCRRCGRDRNHCTCLPDKIKKINHSIAVWCIFYDPGSGLFGNNLFTLLKTSYNRDAINLCAEMMKKRLMFITRERNTSLDGYAVTFSPRRKDSIIRYGFDQSEKIAKSLAAKLGLPAIRTLKNIGDTEQKKLNKKQRAENAFASYEYISGSLKGYTKVILVDDVMTSGATLYACAFQLMKNGATDVIPVTFAKDNFVVKGEKGNVKRNTKYNIARAVKSFVRNGT